MKTYIVYVNGEEVGKIKAASHNAAEKKAKAVYGRPSGGKGIFPKTSNATEDSSISVAYTEV